MNDIDSEAHQPFLLLALNATDSVEWEELDNKVRLFTYFFSYLMSSSRAGSLLNMCQSRLASSGI